MRRYRAGVVSKHGSIVMMKSPRFNAFLFCCSHNLKVRKVVVE
jgi:hypothetical protein